MKKDLLSIDDVSPVEIQSILDLTEKVKRSRAAYADTMDGKSLGLIFQKPSNRTRASFEIAMFQLGGNTLYLGPSEIDMGKRESVKDVGSVLSRYLDVMVARTYRHADIEELARYARVPVINGLSDAAHPCQALCDIFTIRERFGTFRGIRLAYIGDGNNVLNSLLMASSKVGLSVSVATPKGYGLDKKVIDKALANSARSGSRLKFFHSPEEAIAGADCVYTDVWVSMGQESESKKRLKAFRPYQINDGLLKKAKPDCVVMHCLPAHRGQEITDSVIDSRRSIVYDQAENRLHTEKAILLLLLKNNV